MAQSQFVQNAIKIVPTDIHAMIWGGRTTIVYTSKMEEIYLFDFIEMYSFIAIHAIMR